MACYSIYDWGGHCAKILVHSFDYLLRAPNECWTQPRLSGIHNFFWLFVDCKLPKPKEYRRIILCAPPHGTSLFICSASLFRALGLVDVIHCSSSLFFCFLLYYYYDVYILAAYAIWLGSPTSARYPTICFHPQWWRPLFPLRCSPIHDSNAHRVTHRNLFLLMYIY